MQTGAMLSSPPYNIETPRLMVRLAEVADQLGFSDQSNLFRACKRWFGMPPGQYRQQLGQPAPSAAFLAAAASL